MARHWRIRPICVIALVGNVDVLRKTLAACFHLTKSEKGVLIDPADAL